MLETYPLIPPYSHAAVSRDPDTKQLKYYVIEPGLEDKSKETLQRIREVMLDELDVNVRAIPDKNQREEYLRGKIVETVKKLKTAVPKEAMDKLAYYLIRDFVYLGRIEPLVRDHMIEDISCDAPRVPIYVYHREFESLPTNIVFPTTKELDNFIVRLAYLAGRHISVAQPIIDGSLPDGSRINLTYGTEVTRKGSSFTIRKFRADPLTIVDLIAFGTISAEFAGYLWYLIENKASILVAGGVATGKTTFLNTLATFIPPEFKVITIEDTAELNLPHENWIQSVSRVGFGIAGQTADIELFDLLKAALRQRPDYIIVGEIRGEEAYTFFQAITTGHGGLGSIHSDSVQGVIHRLESEPMNIPRTMIASINAIILLNRVTISGRPQRRMVNCTEIIGLDANEIISNATFRWNIDGDTLLQEGASPFIRRTLVTRGVSDSEVRSDLQERTAIMRWMVNRGVRQQKAVSQVVREFYLDKEKVLVKARLGLEP